MSKESESGTPAGGPKVIEYPIHPFCALNPPTPDDEESSLMLSVKANGIQEEIVLCKTGRAINLLDGRTRLKVYNKLVEAGVTVCDNGQPLTLPTFYMPDATTPLEMLQFVISKSTRRNLNQGQKALTGIKTFFELEKETKAAGGEFTVEGDRADFVSRMTGSNRLYCVRGFQLNAEAADLFDGAFHALFSVNAAFACLENRRATGNKKLMPGDVVGEDGDDKDKESKPKEIHDADGVLIDDKRLIKVFESKEMFTEAVSFLNKAKTLIGEAGNSDGGRHLEAEPLQSMVNDLIRNIRGSQPHCVCPKCKNDGEARKSCANCGKQGWLCQRTFKVAEKEAGKGGSSDAAPKAKKAAKPKAKPAERTRKAKPPKKKVEVQFSDEGGAQPPHVEE